VIGSPAYPPDPQRLQTRLQASFARAYRPAGTARQLLAVVADGDRSPMLQHIVAPTRIIHGALDPLVPAPAAHDLAHKIAGAQTDIVAGMGHDLPLPLLPHIAEGIGANAARTAA
jgi:pimeloyl-ACP methyl ester carboxylesterase